MKDLKNLQNTNYLALYRKYRPGQFKDVIGQDLVLQTLENAIKNDKISHAYIFSGDRGTGKTTTARIFAKEIGCSKEDIFELDAASNNGVDNIRELIESTQSSTFGSKYKVYILDEAHMLSKSSFNALLKTIEEPPAHVIFILATTDKHKIPNTIISRCQNIHFDSPSVQNIEKLITEVSEKENIKIDDKAKNKIALEGQGSFRDTLGILEKVFNTINKKEISLKDVEESLGFIAEDEIINIVEAVAEKNISKLLISLNNLNLETAQMIDNLYLDIVKIFELALYMRFIEIDKVGEIFKIQAGEKLIKKTKELADKYPKIISSNNLYKLLEIERELSLNRNLKKTALIAGLIRLIEE